MTKKSRLRGQEDKLYSMRRARRARPYGLQAHRARPYGLQARRARPYGLRARRARPYGLRARRARLYNVRASFTSPFYIWLKFSHFRRIKLSVF